MPSVNKRTESAEQTPQAAAPTPEKPPTAELQGTNLYSDLMGSDPTADALLFMQTCAKADATQLAKIHGDLLAKHWKLLTDLWTPGLNAPVIQSENGDRRFSGSEWQDYPLFDYLKRAYLLTSQSLLDSVLSSKVDEETKRQVEFFTRHYIDAMSPANFAFSNPEVLKLALETKGQSLVQGFINLYEDWAKGYISLSDEASFEVGRNLANTPGAVVYENELIQLIQYSPTTDNVYAIPLVIIPSVVNKFYILDLSPEGSFVRYYVSRGYTVFIVSWRSTIPALQNLTWDDYVEKGVITAIDVAREITGQQKVNTVGYCVGGTLLACALSALASKGESPASSMTQLIAMLDYSDPGEIGVYLGRFISELRLKTLAHGGIVSGKELSRVFASLRANDLIWSFVISNYLKGKTPNAFDLFYWNSDDSNLPGPMFASYLRDFYSDNKLIQPHALTVCGEAIDLNNIQLPIYIFNASEDHLVPWKSGYEGIKHLSENVQFVLGAGGHITGPINPVSKNKRSYWIDGNLEGSADDWFASARSLQGSWWPHHAMWLEKYSGKQIKAPNKLGSDKRPVIEPAPGRYAKEKI
ncbi:alpha/beta fold hydrolase [Paraburkholderia sp. Cy-641]|uniref:PHA/PHB synthase family protein n=1 Tax=Paraburkholderia sp. Cy-641 TaxID=2608337 RepID=UPI00141E10C1|nr:alpha/beta fold hydrolase [Paraburkholderia sp. Cy-641]NIF78051.1 alpha/beta fold hydrolase [Paraburkholderia sp. Cy-641]